jgi:hypothetical protein
MPGRLCCATRPLLNLRNVRPTRPYARSACSSRQPASIASFGRPLTRRAAPQGTDAHPSWRRERREPPALLRVATSHQKSWCSALSAPSASSRTNAGAAECATGGAGAYDPERPQLGCRLAQGQATPPGPTSLSAQEQRLRGITAFGRAHREGKIQVRQGLTAADGTRAHCGERGDQRPPAVLGRGLRESGYLR